VDDKRHGEKGYLDADGKVSTEWLSVLLEAYRDGEIEGEAGEHVIKKLLLADHESELDEPVD